MSRMNARAASIACLGAGQSAQVSSIWMSMSATLRKARSEEGDRLTRLRSVESVRHLYKRTSGTNYSRLAGSAGVGELCSTLLLTLRLRFGMLLLL